MRVFDYRFTVDAPVADVCAFHFEPGILKTLTPPMMIMQVHRFDAMAEGAVADFTMWMGPVPVRWRAEHSAVTDCGFTDTQVSGPMKQWVHTHRFTELDAQRTEVHDHIEFAHHGGVRGVWSRLLFPQAGLRLLFSIRKRITRKEIRRRAKVQSCAGDVLSHTDTDS